MVAFDFWGRWRALPMRPGLRLGLVFCCALIHGLGLAGGLADLGVNSSNLGWSLAGFNIGIELGQIAVALTAALVLRGVRQVSGPNGLTTTTRSASYASMALGSFWFFQRALG